LSSSSGVNISKNNFLFKVGPSGLLNIQEGGGVAHPPYRKWENRHV